MLTGWQRIRITVVMAVAFSAEHADSMLLSAMYLALGRSLDISVSKLGTLSMWRALIQAIVIPFVGIVGNMYNRVWLIAVGTLIWGGMSTGMGFSTNYAEAATWSAMNGIGLALVLPCVQSIMAEVYRARERGRAFGGLFTISACGGMLGNFLAITYSNKHIGRYEGWRVIFFTMAGVAGAATTVVLLGGIEPRNLKEKAAEEPGAEKKSLLRTLWAGTRMILSSTWAVFRIKTFLIIQAAGIAGAIAHAGMGYKVLYFQLLGFSDVAVATISTCLTLGLALGFLMGGSAGDWLAGRFPNAARPAINQLSLLLSMPMSALLYKAMPGCSRFATGAPGSLDRLLPEYGVMCFAIGALASWPASNNAALFAEVVPEAIRTSVYAFDKCVVGAIGALTTPLAGLLAERAFGFTHLSKPHHASPGEALSPAGAARLAREHAGNVASARALENGLLYVMLAPMAIKFMIYFGLYYTLRHDRINEEADEVEKPKEAPLHPVGGAKGGSAAGAGGGGGGSLSLPTLRAGSLGGTQYSSMGGPVSRAELRASLAAEVLATAEGKGTLKLDLESGGSLPGRDERPGQALQGRGGSWGAVSLESASRYLQLEMTPAPAPGATAALPGRPRSAGAS